jgi:two-component system LytT family response regulator
MNKVTAIVTDDELNARKALVSMIQFYCKDVEVKAEAANLSQALKAIETYHPDILFLDIQMPGGNGFDLVNKLKQPLPQIIFVTAHEQFAYKAIKLSALDYLLKPVSPRELIKAVEKAIENKAFNDQLQQKLEAFVTHQPQSSHEGKKIILNTSSEMFIVKIEQIIRCEAAENYSSVILMGGKSIFVSKPLKELDELLSPFGFSRIHQSHLVNLNHINRYEKRSGGYLELSNGEKVPLASRRKDYFLSLIQKFY